LDTALVSALINLGAGFLVVLLIVLGYLVPKRSVDRLLKENDDLKIALDLERRGHDEAAGTAAVILQFLTAMRSLAERRDEQQDRKEFPSGAPGKDAEV
jgi:hypothetical protein